MKSIVELARAKRAKMDADKAKGGKADKIADAVKKTVKGRIRRTPESVAERT